ncbi:hypothetical protein BDD14_0011 [Edaphobacter modestus]|uniref:Uncharacterized protein n=1 Tax=Edaphobacter modestus TaxID=388466 RepID=A0A4Q7YPG2_9BACT|nr:hypothetical protein BDD14_0011 [Edaphobacter modestus]
MLKQGASVESNFRLFKPLLTPCNLQRAGCNVMLLVMNGHSVI